MTIEEILATGQSSGKRPIQTPYKIFHREAAGRPDVLYRVVKSQRRGDKLVIPGQGKPRWVSRERFNGWTDSITTVEEAERLTPQEALLMGLTVSYPPAPKPGEPEEPATFHGVQLLGPEA